ncbi:MAG TPA: GAP family protein [Solirubrobacteraceae bacterium]|jgi:cytochrome c biogenesis protein CcdA|nr:GAP family protein [Solirubrobacteraceae bacterium]
MQTPLLLAIVGLALADSLNPTSLAVAAYLRFVRGKVDVLAFVAAAYITYLAVAVLLTYAVGPAIRMGFKNAPAGTVPALQIVLGGVLIAIGLRTWTGRKPCATRPTPSTKSASALGFMATVADLPTALPLLAASGMIAAAHSGMFAGMGLLIVYVLVCVAPLLAIALIPQRFRGGAPIAGKIRLAGALSVLVAGVCVVLGATASGEAAVALV